MRALIFLLARSSGLTLAPQRPALPASLAAARSRPLVAPMSEVADLPFLEFGLPQHAVADMTLRQAVYAFRLAAGAGFGDGALSIATQLADFRMLSTSSTVGTVNSARGLASALSGSVTSASIMSGVQHAAMLLHHPMMICLW